MSAGVTPVARGAARQARFVPASWIEASLSCVVIALLWPLFAVVAGNTLGRDARYADDPRGVATLPADVLPIVCRDYARSADRSVAADACGISRMLAISSASGVSSRVVDAIARSRTATGASASFACVADLVSRAPTAEDRAPYANLALLAAAALDGRRIAAADATLPAPSRACAGQAVSAMLDRLASTMSEARRASTANAKNAAMRELLRTAGPAVGGARCCSDLRW